MATTFAAGASLEKVIGIDLSAETDYSSTAKINFPTSGSNTASHLCGTTGDPGSWLGPARAMIPRWRIVAAVVVAAAVPACGGNGGTAVGPFGKGGTPGAHCTIAQRPRQIVANGDQFIQNSGPRARILSLSLANDHGIELLRAWIVRITGDTLYGNWLGWPVNRSQLRGVHWDTRQAAVGASIARTSGPHGYNIVLAIRLAPGRRNGLGPRHHSALPFRQPRLRAAYRDEDCHRHIFVAMRIALEPNPVLTGTARQVSRLPGPPSLYSAGGHITKAAPYGLRRGEVVGLRWRALKGGTVTVRQARVLAGYEVVIEEPKSRNGHWTLPLDAALRTLKASQAREKLAAGPAYAASGYVCADRAQGGRLATTF